MTANNPHIYKLKYEDFSEYFVSMPGGGADTRLAAEIVEKFKAANIRIARVVLFGNPKGIANVLPVFDGVPRLIIQNSALTKGRFDNCSVFIQAFGEVSGRFEYVTCNGTVIGALLRAAYGDFLSISGLTSASGVAAVAEETREIYAAIDALLQRYKMHAGQIYRFWNFMKDISTGYLPFNAARDRYFSNNQIEIFPAATGIECEFPGDRQISLSFDAVAPGEEGGVTCRKIDSRWQCDAARYGPKFSRAVLLEYGRDKTRKLHISGTSSVDGKGQSVLRNSIRKNIEYTLAVLLDILKENGMTVSDVVSTIVYVKNSRVFSKFVEIYGEQGFGFPYHPVVTNICRADLLFEIECIAVAGAEPVPVCRLGKQA